MDSVQKRMNRAVKFTTDAHLYKAALGSGITQVLQNDAGNEEQTRRLASPPTL